MPENTATDVDRDQQSVWSEFETGEGVSGSESAEGNVVWGAYCPQEECDELNLFEGDPSKFAKRPYRCQECNWISLMDESVTEVRV